MAELKWFETDLTSTTQTSTGTVNASLNLINHGVDESQMIGRRIYVSHLDINARVAAPADSASTVGALQGSRTFRLLLIQDHQANGSQPTASEILVSPSIFAHSNPDNEERFTILEEWIGTVTPPAAGSGTSTANTFGTTQAAIFIHETIPVASNFLFSTQAGGSRVIGEVRSNNLFILGISENSLLQLTYRIRLNYLDY